jgi:glycosyltransferase involved in cell wall biosynthesis
VELSLVIPAYNEQVRLPATLEAIVAYLSGQPYSWEVIVADDGSEDATSSIAASWSQRDTRVRLVRLPHRGKAMAVREGVRVSTGRFVLFTDADLSTPIDYVEPARELLHAGWDIVIGSREGTQARRVGEPLHRHLMGRVFNRVVQLLVVPGIEDTQCGFKAFRAEVARDLFARSLLYQNGSRPLRGPRVTGFDVELLYLARRCGYRVAVLPVVWRHVEGSKVRPGIDAVLMLRDVVTVWVNGLRGRYDR